MHGSTGGNNLLDVLNDQAQVAGNWPIGVSETALYMRGNRARQRRDGRTQHNDHEIAEAEEAGRLGGVVAETGGSRLGVDGFDMAVLFAERLSQLSCSVGGAIGRRGRGRGRGRGRRTRSDGGGQGACSSSGCALASGARSRASQSSHRRAQGLQHGAHPASAVVVAGRGCGRGRDRDRDRDAGRKRWWWRWRRWWWWCLVVRFFGNCD